jgi:hypothetical protein
MPHPQDRPMTRRAAYNIIDRAMAARPPEFQGWAPAEVELDVLVAIPSRGSEWYWVAPGVGEGDATSCAAALDGAAAAIARTGCRAYIGVRRGRRRARAWIGTDTQAVLAAIVDAILAARRNHH